MTREEIMLLDFEGIELRTGQIVGELADADNDAIEALNAELDAIEERKAVLNAELAEKRAKAEAVAKGAGKEIEKRKDDEKMSNMEIRNSSEYIEAFAKYIKTGKDAECRALLTENVDDGVVPVPELVESRVAQAWENDKIFSRISKSFVPGNLKVGFEISATDAAVHEEGDEAPAEEELVLGIVNMVPANIKKWITVSDEVLALGAADFLAYIYDELTYRIVRKAAEVALGKISTAPASSTSSAVGVATVNGEVTPATILAAIAELGDGAVDNVFIASGAVVAGVRTAALGDNYAYDPFFGLTVIQTEILSSFDGAIIGDLSGVRANLPEGETIKFKFDDLSLAEQDLVKIVGRLYAAIEVVGPKMFAVIDGVPQSE